MGDALVDAVRAGEKGAQLALEYSERDGFDFEAALRFLHAYAVTHCFRPFSSEDVVAVAETAGIVASSPRAWGPVFKAGARRGMIRRSTQLYRRSNGHGSVGVCWESV